MASYLENFIGVDKAKAAKKASKAFKKISDSER